MKKLFILLLALIMLCSVLTGCGKKEEDDIIIITMSDEAKQYQKEVTEADGTKAALSEEYFDKTLETLSAREGQTFPECELVNKLSCEECAGCEVYTLEKDNYENIILYTHGGGWAFGISEEHVTFCDALVTRFNAKVYMPLYPLAPQATSEETYNMIETLYKQLLEEGKDIYIMGDSAGGNITLGLMYTIKEEGLEKPEKMVLIAPCSNMTFSNGEMQELDKTDPVLSFYGCSRLAVIWAGKSNLESPKNSALYADLSGYPDTIIFQGTNDILCPDNLLLFEKMEEAGVNVKLVKGEGLWHVFPVDPIPEREEALDILEEYCFS